LPCSSEPNGHDENREGSSEREDHLILANEFAEVTVRKVRTRNGMRLEVSAPKLGRYILLCPLELEALTWQTTETFSRLLSTPFGPEPEPEELD
jgi:hypothetical protein